MSINALQQCLGADFGRLLPVVQRAHRGQIELQGIVDVARGRGLAGLFAAAMKMPAANQNCRMSVHGDHLADRMIWHRSFDGKSMKSNFVRQGDHLIEMMGPLRMRLKPQAINGRLHYELGAAYIGPVKLPKFLTPELIAWEGEAEGYYEFEVEIRLPLIGRLVRYAGRLTLISG